MRKPGSESGMYIQGTHSESTSCRGQLLNGRMDEHLFQIISCVTCMWEKRMRRLEGRREPGVMGPCRWWVHMELGPGEGRSEVWLLGR